MHATGLLEIATVATAALVLGLLLQRLRQPAIVGYIVAGVALGPSALGLVVDDKPVRIFAELGVLMLLFVIGMEMSLRGFRRVLRLAVSAAALQIVLSVAVMLIVTRLFDRSMEIGIVLGFVVALSSTAVAIKLLEDIGELRTDIGRTAISVLIAQDLAVVPMLLIVNGLASGDGMPLSGYAKLVAAIGLLALMIVVLTRRERVGLPFARVVEGNIELTAITALAYCFGAALLSALVGLSAAYGAFLAGLWIGNSTARTSILQAALPIQSVLLMMFFLSIGLLLDLTFIWEHLGEVLVLLLVVTLFKTAMNVGILRLVGEPWPRAWIAGIVIGQIGEFSFVLIAAAMAAGLTDEAGGKLAMSVIALSLMLSPLWLITARRLGRLVWNNITGFGQIWAGIYGEEAHAVVVVTQRTARFSMRMGSQGVEAIRHLLPGHEQPETENKDTDKDAGFEEGSPRDATDDAAEAPKSVDETKP
jgi:CPA2 family monovalent cation:H+ antiporter-2